jgi:hypothetical protein
LPERVRDKERERGLASSFTHAQGFISQHESGGNEKKIPLKKVVKNAEKMFWREKKLMHGKHVLDVCNCREGIFSV